MSSTVRELLAQMTIEEKAALCSGADFWNTKAIGRLGIPAVRVSDGPHGLRAEDPSVPPPQSLPAVCFPAGCAAAAGFDTGLVEKMGRALGAEARAAGVDVLLGPAVNIKRSPLCGRNFEYYSEDPYLAGELAVAYIRGVQSQGVGTSIKHFAANNQEYRRLTCSSELDERTLREIYLPAFEAAVRRAKPWTVMCSYNRLNGTHASENKHLLTDILRSEWGFEGTVVSDWGAVSDRVAGVRAGLDLEMPACPAHDQQIAAAVRAGTLPEADLDRAAGRVLELAMRAAGHREDPCAEADLDADHDAAAAMAAQCAVLLKNRGVLPLGQGQRIAYIGGFAAAPRYQGGGSSHVNAWRVDSALDAARRRGRSVDYVEGFPADRDQREEAEFLRAVEAAEAADAAVIFAGLPESFESEGYDRRHLRLPDAQNNLIARIAAVQKNTVVVLHTGSPVECPWADDVGAILCMYLGGEGVGRAADALLYGEADPSGRLPETWPLRLEDTPCYLDFPGNGRTAHYREGVYVGYRWYDARRMPVRWPFGHGLSYTGFVYRDAALSAPVLEEGGQVEVSVTVRNSGARFGHEVVQLYVAGPEAAPNRPPQALRRFAKVALQPGAQTTVRFALTARDLCVFDPEMGDWYADSGEYTIRIGHSSRNVPVTLPLRYRSSRRRPLVIDENATLGDLLRDERTAPVIRAMLARFGQRLGDPGTSPEATAQALDGTPLRAMASFGGAEGAAALPGVLAALRGAVPPPDERS